MKIPIELLMSCFGKTAQPVLPPAPGMDSLEALDYFNNRETPLKDKAIEVIKNVTQPGHPVAAAAMLAAALGGGYLMHKGMASLVGAKPAGGIKDKLEKALLAQSALVNEGAMRDLAGQLQSTKDTLFRRNMLVGSLGLSALAPHILPLIKERINPTPQPIQLQLTSQNGRNQNA